jgi:TfoX/Sxy family transcriptional regulator of competence genes
MFCYGGMNMPWEKANTELINLLENAMKDYPCDRRPMFGSPCYFMRSNMFAGVHENTVIIRLPEDDRKEIYSRYKEVLPFTPMGRVMKEYAALPVSICRDAAIFKCWLERSFQYASSLPPKVAKGKAKR